MKRLVVCCDGTWCTATEPDKITNIVRIARSIPELSRDGCTQKVYYDSGVGTDGMVDAISGGLYGEGMDKNVLDAFRFLIDNYEDGDELYFFGFSRGAYTVRSLIGLIRNAGLLKTEHVDKLSDAYTLYRSTDPLDHPNGEAAQSFRLKNSVEVNVQFLGVFDTVGALGIPLTLLDSFNAAKYGFHDTTLSKIIRNAYHALAIDEKRYDFYPTLWQAKPDTKSEQRFFPGAHSDVGGGTNDSSGLSGVTLQWMLSKAYESGLESLHDGDLVVDELAPLHDSYMGMSRLLGYHARHVCDRDDLTSPHYFNSAHSWFRSPKDESAPEPIGLLRTVAAKTFFGSERAICRMTDMKLDPSAIKRMEKLPDYRPLNVVPSTLLGRPTAERESADDRLSDNKGCYVM